MQPVFNPSGTTVAWFENGVIYDLDGYPDALVAETAIYSYDGDYIGLLEDGFFWDREGYAVAFLGDAHNGPPLPSAQTPPAPPIARLSPAPLPAITRERSAIRHQQWSVLDWDDYLFATEESVP